MFFGPKVDLTPNEFREALEKEGGIVVDCRSADECASGMYPNAVQADWLKGAIQSKSQSWDKQLPVYCYCRSGGRSAASASFLKKAGFNKVYNVGGFSQLNS